MTEQEKAQLLADWLAQPPGTPPPEGLDPDVVGAIWALRPDRAPAARVSLDDVLDSVTEGPYARQAKVVAFPTPQQRAATATPAKPTRRPQRWVPVLALGLAAAAAAMIVIPMAGNLSSPDRGADELSRMEAPAAAPSTIPEAAPVAAPSPEQGAAERDATVPADVVAADTVTAAPSAGPGAPSVATADAPAESERADKDAEGGPGDFAEEAEEDAKPSPRAAAQNAASPPPASGLDSVGGVSAGFGSAPGATGTLGARGGGGVQGGASGSATSTSTSTPAAKPSVAEEKRREQSERTGIAELSAAPAEEPAAPPPVAQAPARSAPKAPAKSASTESTSARSPSGGRAADEGAALEDAADDRAEAEEVQSLSKAKKESEPRRRLPKGDAAPSAPAASAPAAAPVTVPATEVSTRASATPLDYDGAWYTRRADVVTAYDAAHAYEVAGAYPAAARAYAALASDARVDVAQDAAWRGAKAWRAAGVHDQALALTQQGLRRSSANTVFRSNLLALQGDLFALSGRQAEAEASWREAARLNAAR